MYSPKIESTAERDPLPVGIGEGGGATDEDNRFLMMVNDDRWKWSWIDDQLFDEMRNREKEK